MIGIGKYLLLDGVVGKKGGGDTFFITSFTASPAQAEVGSTQSVNLAWVMGINPDTQSINQGIGSLAPTVRNYNGIAGVTTNKTWTLTAIKDSVPYVKTATISFLRKRYWFASADPNIGNTNFNFADLPVGFSQEFLQTRAATKVFDCSGGKYFYYMYPASFGVGDQQFIFSGLTYALNQANIRTITFINESGNSTSYIVLRSDNILFSSSISINFI